MWKVEKARKLSTVQETARIVTVCDVSDPQKLVGSRAPVPHSWRRQWPQYDIWFTFVCNQAYSHLQSPEADHLEPVQEYCMSED